MSTGMHIKLTKQVFLLFCAMNAMGYDDENNDRGMSPTRKQVRKQLRGYSWEEKYPQLKKAFKTYHQWHLLKVILVKPKRVTRTSVLNGFAADFKRFSKEPLIRKLWETLETPHVKNIKKLLPIFEQATHRLVAFVGRPPRGVQKIVLIATPLDAYWRGYGFRAEGTSYIVVGPGAEKNQGELIRHELLHILVPALQLPKKMIVDRRHKHLTTQGYGNTRVINNEYVVRSLDLFYESTVMKRDISKDIKHEEKDFPHIRESMAFIKTQKEKGRF